MLRKPLSRSLRRPLSSWHSPRRICHETTVSITSLLHARLVTYFLVRPTLSPTPRPMATASKASSSANSTTLIPHILLRFSDGLSAS